MTILKRQFLVTVLSRESDPLEFDTLSELDEAISEGPHIGSWERVAGQTIVHERELRDELLAIGNDGTFFDDDCLGDEQQG